MIKLRVQVLLFCIAIIFSILFTSCTKDAPTASPPLPLPPSTSGSWSGTLTAGGVSGSFLLILSQDVIRFTGTGNLGSLALSVSGENHYPDIQFIGRASGYVPLTFTGAFSSSREFSGVVNGSGFTNAVATFTKD